VLGRRQKVLHRVDVVYRFDAAAPSRRSAACEADVVRDLEQPRELRIGSDAALQRAMRVQERRLDCVLCLFARSEAAEAEAEYLPRIPLEQVTRSVGPFGVSYRFCGGDAAPRRWSYDGALSLRLSRRCGKTTKGVSL
jgi:hypothetical protein